MPVRYIEVYKWRMCNSCSVIIAKLATEIVLEKRKDRDTRAVVLNHALT